MLPTIMRIILSLIFLIQIKVSLAQNASLDLLIGTWRFEKKVDFDKINENKKSELVNTTFCPIETENGTEYPDRIFKANNEYEFYYSKQESRTGFFEIKKNKIICWRLAFKEPNYVLKVPIEVDTEKMEYYLKRKLVTKKEDGNYYFSKPVEFNIKSITKDRIEFGKNEKYSVWKKIR